MEFKRFFQFSLFIKSYRGLKFRKNFETYFICFIHIWIKFSSILTKFSSILLKYVKFVNSSVIDLISKDRGGLLNCSIRVFSLEFYGQEFQIRAQ